MPNRRGTGIPAQDGKGRRATVCGIAGINVASGIELDLTATARLLLAGLAERGQDATGYAFHGPDGIVEVHKDSVRLADFLEHVAIPSGACTVILHVRDFTKGRPGLNDNNHPIRYGRVVGVHNGHLDNDDELFAEAGKERSTPEISVDSEAIMMLADELGDLGDALTRVKGSAAVALLRDGEPGRLSLAKRASRTLFVGTGHGVTLFASTREPLGLAAKAMDRRLSVAEIRDGTALEIGAGDITDESRFAVDRRYVGRKLVSYPHLPEKAALVRLALASF
jgi:glutamine phosphoribosylpyrophosphate amidotransferase